MFSLKNFTKTLLIFGVFTLTTQQSQAGLISTKQVVDQLSLQEKRNQISAFLQRSDVEQQFTRLGLSSQEAQARMNALSDDEVLQISDRLDQLPAGQDAVGAILGTALLVFIILLITDILHLTKVFSFTR